MAAREGDINKDVLRSAVAECVLYPPAQSRSQVKLAMKAAMAPVSFPSHRKPTRVASFETHSTRSTQRVPARSHTDPVGRAAHHMLNVQLIPCRHRRTLQHRRQTIYPNEHQHRSREVLRHIISPEIDFLQDIDDPPAARSCSYKDRLPNEISYNQYLRFVEINRAMENSSGSYHYRQGFNPDDYVDERYHLLVRSGSRESTFLGRGLCEEPRPTAFSPPTRIDSSSLVSSTASSAESIAARPTATHAWSSNDAAAYGKKQKESGSIDPALLQKMPQNPPSTRKQTMDSFDALSANAEHGPHRLIRPRPTSETPLVFDGATALPIHGYYFDQCDECGRRFHGKVPRHVRGNIQRHIKNLHKGKPIHYCPFTNCNGTFSRSDAVWKHVREQHHANPSPYQTRPSTSYGS